MSPAATMTADAAAAAILAAADRLFYERGIAGVAISEVRDGAGVSLRRLYSLYPTKRELVAAWLTDRHGRWMTWFADAVDHSIAQGNDPVPAAFDALAEWFRSPGYRGCAFINAMAETAEIDESHRALVRDHKRSLTVYLGALTARTHSHIPPWWPDAVAALIDGAIVQSAILRSETPITAARTAASQILESLS